MELTLWVYQGTQEDLAENSFTWKLQAVLLEAAEATVLGNTKLYGKEGQYPGTEECVTFIT